MKTYLVTGGAGFIGSHIAERLIADGHRVVIIDNESTGRRENVPAGAVYVRGDVVEPLDLQRAFALPLDGVFHVAGQASTIRSFDQPQHDLQVNVLGTLNVIQACIEHDVPRLLFASSMTVYGFPQQIPVPETEPCRPISYYGIGKYAAERYVLATGERSDLKTPLNVTAFRMFNVYGERQSLNNPYQGVAAIFIANLMRAEPITIHSDGEQSRDFVYVGDVVNAWVEALNAPNTYGHTFNIGSGSRQSINQLVDATLASFGQSRANYFVRYTSQRPGDQRHMMADISKLQHALSWRPRVLFEEGMARTIRWATQSATQTGI